ncbi:hypothetical protein CRG98_002647, partial [Punica granatum]
MRRRTPRHQPDGSRVLPLLRPISGDNKLSRFNFTGRRHQDMPNRDSCSSKLPASPYSSTSQRRDFAALPYDLLQKIAGSFSHPNLQSASLVCRAWRDALQPLREAMLFLRWGKRFKHGRRGVRQNPAKALDSFLKGAARGSTLAMVDAGLIYWEMGKKDKAIQLYQRAAALGDPAGQCNLGISYLQ